MVLLASLRNCVIPLRSFIFLCLLPPRFFLPESIGGGKGLTGLTGGGSCNFSKRLSISDNKYFPCSPFGLP